MDKSSFFFSIYYGAFFGGLEKNMGNKKNFKTLNLMEKSFLSFISLFNH